MSKQSILNRSQYILHSTFGYKTFRALQEKTIESILEKRDTLLLMPTGGGKSLCYQIPALMFEGLTVVVSPLISLMQDQVNQLKELGVEAELLNSTLSWEEYQMNKQLVISGRTKILYMAPETLFKEDILRMLEDVRLDLIAIDEAHCISEWGHDFRPEYRQLAEARRMFPSAVCLALTATATPRVREDIRKNLEINNPQEFVASFNRDNLFYEIIPKSNPFKQTIDFLKGFPDQSGIIYCFSRKQVDTLAGQLTEQGFSALPYHAGLSDEVRRSNQEQFIRDDVQIMVATIAFGMGINKPNVRFVLHYDLPRNIESYYQETGRAGRDGLPAHCLLLFGYGDIHKVKFLIQQKSDNQERQVALLHLNSVVQYAETHMCRRIPLINYFGEKYMVPKCDRCDNCVTPKTADFDLTLPAKKLLAGIMRTGQRFGAGHVIDVIRGANTQKINQYDHQDLDIYGVGKEFSVKQWQFILRQLMQKDILRRTEDKYGILKFTPESFNVLNGELKVTGLPPPADTAKSKAVKAKSVSGDDDYDQRLFNQLRNKRKELADRHNVPPYVIFPDKSLVEMAQQQPRTIEDFARIYGVGEKKLKKYARIFINLIEGYTDA